MLASRLLYSRAQIIIRARPYLAQVGPPIAQQASVYTLIHRRAPARTPAGTGVVDGVMGMAGAEINVARRQMGTIKCTCVQYHFIPRCGRVRRARRVCKQAIYTLISTTHPTFEICHPPTPNTHARTLINYTYGRVRAQCTPHERVCD